MAAAFGSGFVFSLVSSSGGPSIPGAVGTGALFALLQGGIHKVIKIILPKTLVLLQVKSLKVWIDTLNNIFLSYQSGFSV